MHNVSGIYLIQSKTNQRRYIGSSTRVARRFKQHFNDLKNSRHGNEHLQDIYNKYGEDDLIFTVIEKVEDADKLLEREQWYIDNWKPEINMRPTAGSPLGFKSKNAKYISFYKRDNKYKIAYSIDGTNYKFGQYDSLEKANEILEYILFLSDEDKVKYYNENHNRKLTAKNYSYDKASDRYRVSKFINNFYLSFGAFKTEQEVIYQVAFLNTLTDDQLKDHYLQNYNKNKTTKYYYYNKHNKAYLVRRAINGKEHYFGYFKDEEAAKKVANYVKSLPENQVLLFKDNMKHIDFTLETDI